MSSLVPDTTRIMTEHGHVYSQIVDEKVPVFSSMDKKDIIDKDIQIEDFMLDFIFQVDRTRRTYFSEESDALQTGSKAKDADDKARGKKKDVASFFQSTKALRKKAGNLSVQQEEADIKSTGARNDYILGLATANAHQEQYFKHDLQVNLK